MSEFVPEGWKVSSVSEVANNFDGKRVALKSTDRAARQGRYRYYGASNIIDYVDDYIFDGDYILLGEDGENVLSRNLPLAFIVKGKFWVNNHAHVLQPKKNIDIGYLCEVLEAFNYKNIASGSAQPKITQGALNQISLLFPPLPEQQKIAAILTSVDEVIEKTQAQINKLKDLKTGMMQELLTRGVGVDGKPHTEFKDSPVGRIPMAWDCVQMDTICEKITDGEHQTPIRTNDGYYLLSARNVRDGYIDLTNVDYVGEAEFQRISKRISPKQGDVLISCSGSVGRVAVVPPGLEFSMVRSVAILQLKSECVDSEFMALQVSATATQYQIEQSLSQQAQANLFQGAIKKLIVVVPSLLEQQQIANIVNSMTVKIITQQNKLKATKSLKKALMQDLLTGKVRVKVDTE